MASDFEEFLKVLAGGVRGYARSAEMRKERERQAAREEEDQRRYEAEREARESQAAQRQANVDRAFGAQMLGMDALPPETMGPQVPGSRTYEGWTVPPEETEEQKFQTLLDQISRQSEAARERGGAPGQVFGGDQWQWPPGYGRVGAGAGGPSGADLSRFRKWAEDEANRTANASGWIDDVVGGVRPEFQGQWNAAFETALQGFMGGAPAPEGGELRLGNEMVQFMQDVAAGNPEALAELARLKDPNNPEADPAYAWLIELGAQNIPTGTPAETRSIGFPAELAIALGGLVAKAPRVGWPDLEDIWRRGQVSSGSGGGAR